MSVCGLCWTKYLQNIGHVSSGRSRLPWTVSASPAVCPLSSSLIASRSADGPSPRTTMLTAPSPPPLSPPPPHHPPPPSSSQLPQALQRQRVMEGRLAPIFLRKTGGPPCLRSHCRAPHTFIPTHPSSLSPSFLFLLPPPPPLLLLPPTQLVRVSMTSMEAWVAYFRVSSRLEELRAKNVPSRRRRHALFTQLRATTGLKTLSLVNVQHPCTGRC